MNLESYVPVFALIGLICYSFKKWVLKGEIFHPGVVYTFVNSIFFLSFAFGPYIYKANIHWLYNYIYALTIISFVAGISILEKRKTKTFIKDINLKRKQLFYLFFVLIMTLLFLSIYLGYTNNFSIEEAAHNRLYKGAVNLAKEQVNFVQIIVSSFLIAFFQISLSIFISSVFKIKKYISIPILFCLMVTISLFQNSRTLLIFSFLIFFIPIYTVSRYIYGAYSWSRLIKFLKKQYKIIPIVFAVIVLFIFLTNIRGEVRVAFISTKTSSYQLIEEFYNAEQKKWFSSAIDSWLAPVADTIAEMSMYTGGTVASGGVISRIASETELHTWGLRNFFVFHRVLAQLRLDAGFSDEARENYYIIKDRAIREMPAILTGWLGEPGNWIIDFGYLGAPIASLIVGGIVGWMYGRLATAGPIIHSAATSVFALAMLISPSISFFGTFFSNSISFLIFLYYLRKNSYRRIITTQQYSSDSSKVSN